MGEMLSSQTEFKEDKKKTTPPKPKKKSDVTQLVEGEIARDQERWRVAVTDAVSTKSTPPAAVIARLAIAWGITDPSEASRAFTADMQSVKSHRVAVAAAETNSKKKAAWLKEHGTKRDLEQQRNSLEESLLQVKSYLAEYNRLEGSGTQYRPQTIEARCKRMWPTETQTHS